MNKSPRTISPYQQQLLAEIFRVILKEIVSDEDKEQLAPGEIGISYGENTLYVKNPHTGELISPNSTEFINQILSKYDHLTNILNADKVNGIRFYSHINQLTQLGISLTPDSIIRQMEYPGILMSPVTYDNYEVMGFPSNSGMILVFKVSPEFVMVSYYDFNTYTTYDGRYNRFKHMFDGWIVSGNVDNEYVETEGGGDHTNIRSDKELTDMMLLTVRVTETLNPGCTVRYNGSEPYPIVNADGSELSDQIAANNIIMLIYDEQEHVWRLVSGDESSVSATVNIMGDRLENMQVEMNKIVEESNKKLTELKNYVDQQVDILKARPGKIDDISILYTATQDNERVFNITSFNYQKDKLIINYNQTVLRKDTDYTFTNEGHVQLLTFGLNVNDKLLFIILKQE